jgi:hypothetical protein
VPADDGFQFAEIHCTAKSTGESAFEFNTNTEKGSQLSHQGQSISFFPKGSIVTVE